jgi:CYTH domain-containing protein
MPNEIERKFLVSSDDWKKLVTHSVRIRDGLIAASYGQKVRVRIAGHKATITVKGSHRLCAPRIRVPMHGRTRLAPTSSTDVA